MTFLAGLFGFGRLFLRDGKKARLGAPSIEHINEAGHEAGPKAPAAAAQAGNRVRLQEPSTGPCRRTRDSRIRLPTFA